MKPSIWKYITLGIPLLVEIAAYSQFEGDNCDKLICHLLLPGYFVVSALNFGAIGGIMAFLVNYIVLLVPVAILMKLLHYMKVSVKTA
jgi:hypothetical protein